MLQQLNDLSDERIEYQVPNRLSFMRFFGLQLEDKVPDTKTIWLFRGSKNWIGWQRCSRAFTNNWRSAVMWRVRDK